MAINRIRTKAYKVCARVGDKLVGVMAANRYLPSGYVVEYKVGNLAKAKVGKLFAFTQLESARKFAHGVPRAEIYEVEAYGAKQAGLGMNRRLHTSYLLPTTLEDFWRWMDYFWKGHEVSYVGHIMSVPANTIYCSAVRLVKQVSLYE